MSQRKSPPQEQPPKRVTLQVSRAEARTKLEERIENGRTLLERPIQAPGELEEARAEYRKWDDYNQELLKRIADTDELLHDYVPTWGSLALGERSLHEEIDSLRTTISARIEKLESIVDRLELLPEANGIPSSTVAGPSPESRSVFVVHGRDETTMNAVARCLETLECDAVVLHEQPNRGRTIIEKFEDYSTVGFAVVLLTPDDVGAAADQAGSLRPRARQNVILELGFFIGRLGRERVCALYKGDLEIPSDYSGVLWVPFDNEGMWRFRLARELQAAGIRVDMNKIR